MSVVRRKRGLAALKRIASGKDKDCHEYDYTISNQISEKRISIVNDYRIKN